MKVKKFDSILVANRGEIALRIVKAIHALNKRAVVVHSHVDRSLPFVKEADEAFSLGTGKLAETYLDQVKILTIAGEAGVDAIHPGYGFLSENAEFALACQQANIPFIGPNPEVIRIMGDKSMAREKAIELGIPVIKGLTGSRDELAEMAHRLSFPLLIKPSAGGGGKGMRIVNRVEQFEEAAREASREAESYFGSGDLYLELFLVNPRHIEVQVIADHHGNAVHLFERECSIQRRYQKIIEEAPSPSVSQEGRRLITGYALELVKKIGYSNAGTVEFLMDESGNFYFLEMNARIQVEHPVTEMLTGIDLVREQITIAEGQALSFSQEDVKISGHAIEARLCAEDPGLAFTPSPGTIGTFQIPVEKKLRVDSGYQEGNAVDALYDSLIAKVIAHDSNRTQAIETLSRSLKKLHITGPLTNRDYLISLLQSDHFTRNHIHTAFIDSEGEKLFKELQDRGSGKQVDSLLLAAAFIALQGGLASGTEATGPWQTIGRWRMLPEITLRDTHRSYSFRYQLVDNKKTINLHLDGKNTQVVLKKRDGFNYQILVGSNLLELWAATHGSEILLDMDGRLSKFRRTDLLDERYPGEQRFEEKEKNRQITAPISGRVVRVNCLEGGKVHEGESLLVIESMKMENKILSPRQSIVNKTHVQVGQQVQKLQLLITLDNYERPSIK